MYYDRTMPALRTVQRASRCSRLRTLPIHVATPARPPLGPQPPAHPIAVRTEQVLGFLAKYMKVPRQGGKMALWSGGTVMSEARASASSPRSRMSIWTPRQFGSSCVCASLRV